MPVALHHFGPDHGPLCRPAIASTTRIAPHATCSADKTPPAIIRYRPNDALSLANALAVAAPLPNMNCSSPWLFSSNHGHIIPNVAAIGKVGSQSAYL
jgi:hypothetical protein